MSPTDNSEVKFVHDLFSHRPRAMEVADKIDMLDVIVNKRLVTTPAHITSDASIGSLQFWMTCVILGCSTLVLLATLDAFKFKNLLTYRGKDGNALVRGYLQKMAIYNTLILGILYVTYTFVFDRSEVKDHVERCFRIGEHKLITFLLVFGSSLVGLIRFLAVGFAHSDAYDFGGTMLHEGFSVHTNHIYKNFVPPYAKSALLALILVLVFLHCPLPATIRDPVLGAEFCLSSWIYKGNGHPLAWSLLPTVLIIFLPVISATIIEHFAHIIKNGFYTAVPGYYSILNAPFIMVALTTTWSMWFGILFVVWLTFGLGAGEYFSILALFYTSCDSVAVLLTAIIVGRKNRVLC